MKPTPWYHFWNPTSGFVGGLLAGVILGSIYGVIAWAVWS